MKSEGRNIFLSRSDFQAELAELWRVIVAIIVVQLISGCLALVLGPYGFAFIDFWFGGAVGTLLGFVIGVIWQFMNRRSSLSNHRQMLVFLAAASVALFCLALFLPMGAFAAQAIESSEM